MKDVKKMQRWVESCYRHIWTAGRGPPLRLMQATGMNMQHLRNEMEIRTLRIQIEKRRLGRICHVLRTNSERTTKVAVLGWLETSPKTPGKKRKSVLYWKKLLREAGME